MKPATTVKTMGSDCDSFLETFQRARELNLCPNRIWAVAGENIPKLLPDFNLIPRAGERFDEHGDYSEHNECTLDFCEYSQRDFYSGSAASRVQRGQVSPTSRPVLESYTRESCTRWKTNRVESGWRLYARISSAIYGYLSCLV
jgi:hypothetical protein